MRVVFLSDSLTTVFSVQLLKEASLALRRTRVCVYHGSSDKPCPCDFHLRPSTLNAPSVGTACVTDMTWRYLHATFLVNPTVPGD